MIIKIDLSDYGFPAGQVLHLEVIDNESCEPGATLDYEGYPAGKCATVVAVDPYLDALEKQGFDLKDAIAEENLCRKY